MRVQLVADEVFQMDFIVCGAYTAHGLLGRTCRQATPPFHCSGPANAMSAAAVGSLCSLLRPKYLSCIPLSSAPT
jgi:hypothetical protein